MTDFNAAEYFHINPIEMEAADPTPIPKNIGTRQSKRNPSYQWMKSMFGGEYNPDKLDYRVYDDMLKDPQIQTAYRLISYMLRSKKWVITPASQDPLDEEIADFVRDGLESMRIPMRQVRADQLTAMKYGYAVGETVFKLNDKYQIVPDAIYSIPINTLVDCFEYDDNGEIITVHQNVGGTNPIKIPAEKCLINTFDEEFGNKYGQSILNQLYDTHFMKSNVEKWRMGYLDKLEGPTVIGKSTNRDQMQTVLNDMHGGTLSGVVDPEDEIQIIESSHRGEGFKIAIDDYNTQIFRAFMIGSLLLGQAQNQGGSYGQSKTHDDIFKTFGDGVHEDSAIPWQEFIKHWVDMNYNTEKYPKFSFEPLTEKDLLTLLEKLQPVAEKFVSDPKEIGLPQLIEQILRQYADIELESNEPDHNQPDDKVVPSEEDLNNPLPNEIINNQINDSFPNQ